jgi:hypothetical protein
MRPQLVAERVDQRVQTATTATAVVDTAARICAGIRAAVGATTPVAAVVGAVGHPGMGSGSSAMGRLGRSGLGAELTSSSESLALVQRCHREFDLKQCPVDVVGR